eukprot:jgi/Mesvir1/587/Mv02029-RA.1
MPSAPTSRWISRNETTKDNEQPLAKILWRLGVKLYGADGCASCRAQKAMLYNLSPNHWKDMYVNCDRLKNSLVCADVNKVPMWRIAGSKFIGKRTPAELDEILKEKQLDEPRHWNIGGKTRRHWRRGHWAVKSYANFVGNMVMRAMRTNSVLVNNAGEN